MFFRDMSNARFVCLDDITGTPENLNKVIYNPARDSKDVIPERLFNGVEEKFGVKLSLDEIMSLTSYDEYHLNEFANDLRKIINNKRVGL